MECVRPHHCTSIVLHLSAQVDHLDTNYFPLKLDFGNLVDSDIIFIEMFLH